MKEIIINSAKFGIHKVLVDDNKFDELNRRTWCVNKKGNKTYAETKVKRVISIMMHRLLMDVTDPKIYIDHIDGNGLNNQMNNLRVSTHSENLCNRGAVKNSKSKYKGVAWVTSHKLWRASISKDKVSKVLGYFKSDEEAAHAYDAAAKIHHGEFANLNFK